VPLDRIVIVDVDLGNAQSTVAWTASAAFAPSSSTTTKTAAVGVVSVAARDGKTPAAKLAARSRMPVAAGAPARPSHRLPPHSCAARPDTALLSEARADRRLFKPVIDRVTR
jgi:hypothetical protein